MTGRMDGAWPWLERLGGEGPSEPEVVTDGMGPEAEASREVAS